MRTLRESIDSFDRDANFAVEYTSPRGTVRRAECYVFDASDCKIKPGVFVMQKSGTLKSHYTEEDIAHRQRLNTEAPVKAGDIVEFNGKPYTVKVMGDYSDLGRLIPV